jgi:hypothetical protein
MHFPYWALRFFEVIKIKNEFFREDNTRMAILAYRLKTFQ